MNDDHIYDDPSTLFNPDNFATQLPPSFNKSIDTFNKNVLATLKPAPPSSRGKLPAPPIGGSGVLSSSKQGATFAEPVYAFAEPEYAFAEPEYDELGMERKADVMLKGPTAEYSELDIETMPPRQYGNIGANTALPNPYEFETPPTSRAPTPKEAESISRPHAEPIAIGNPSPNYQSLLNSTQQQAGPRPDPNYQPLGPPVGYAVPSVATLTRSAVPQPTLGGWTGEKGKNPFKAPPTKGQEGLEEYIIMHSPEI